MKKISVIIPVYNSENYLEKCLDSVVNQTLKDIEIIIINDSSKDNSLKIIKKYQKKYENIILINNKINLGIGKSRNKGLEIATGEYITFLDSDDYIALDGYEIAYKYIKKNKLDFITNDYYKVENNQINIFETKYFDISTLNKNPEIIVKMNYGPANKIIKNSIIKENDIKFEENLKYEDVPFVSKALLYSNKIGHLNKPYYYYNIHFGSETTTMDKRVYDILEIIKIVNNQYENKYHDEIEYFTIKQITRYMLRQKYQKNKKIKNDFIDKGYKYLLEIYPNYKKNKYYLKESKLKRIIKNNKILLKIYCLIGGKK